MDSSFQGLSNEYPCCIVSSWFWPWKFLYKNIAYLEAIIDAIACQKIDSMKERREKAPNLMMVETKNGFYGFEVASFPFFWD